MVAFMPARPWWRQTPLYSPGSSKVNEVVRMGSDALSDGKSGEGGGRLRWEQGGPSVTDVPTIRGGDPVTPGEYRALLEAVGWRVVEEPAAELQRALETTWNVTARTAEGGLVGLARVLDDGHLYASVWDVIVAPAWQRQGIGRALMGVVQQRTTGRLVVLVATAAAENLYRTMGFTERDGGSIALFLRPDPGASHSGKSDGSRS